MVKKVSKWSDIKKTRESNFEIDGIGVVRLRGISERERIKATEDSTTRDFDKIKKEYKSNLDEENFGYRLIMAGWIKPDIPGETFEDKREELKGVGFAVLQRIAIRINELSGISRKDIDDAKNSLDLA